MKDILYTAISIFIISLVFVFGVSVYASTPDVWVSHSTNECVKVINYTDEATYSCENMPTNYNKVWVK